MPPKRKRISLSHSASEPDDKRPRFTPIEIKISPTTPSNPHLFPELMPIILQTNFQRCCICTALPVDVVCCPRCQNGPFCRNCFKNWLEEKKNCPTCSKPVPTFPSVNKVLQKIVLGYKAKCGHDGCLITGSFESMIHHMKACELAVVRCRNHNSGCLATSQLIDAHAHEESCTFNKSKCSCGAVVLIKDQADHEEVCPDACVNCKLCSMRLARRLIDAHNTTECKKRQVKCDNESLGCAYQGTYENFKKHQGRCKFNTAAEKIREVQESMNDLRQRLEKQQEIVSKVAMLAPTKGEKTVSIKVDFGEDNGKVFSDIFEIANLQCKLVFQPIYQVGMSRIAFLPVSFCNQSSFLVALKYSVCCVTQTNGTGVNLYCNGRYRWGFNYDNHLIEKFATETLDWKVQVELLEVLSIGDMQEAARLYSKWEDFAKQPSMVSEKKVCTGTIHLQNQQLFHCSNCLTLVCQVCAEQCHQGHEVAASSTNNSLCDCFMKCHCKTLKFSKLLEN